MAEDVYDITKQIAEIPGLFVFENAALLTLAEPDNDESLFMRLVFHPLFSSLPERLSAKHVTDIDTRRAQLFGTFFPTYQLIEFMLGDDFRPPFGLIAPPFSDHVHPISFMRYSITKRNLENSLLAATHGSEAFVPQAIAGDMNPSYDELLKYLGADQIDRTMDRRWYLPEIMLPDEAICQAARFSMINDTPVYINVTSLGTDVHGPIINASCRYSIFINPREGRMTTTISWNPQPFEPTPKMLRPIKAYLEEYIGFENLESYISRPSIYHSFWDVI